MNEDFFSKEAPLSISEIAKEGYRDLAKPAAKEVGTTIGYIAKFATNILGRPFDHLSKRLEHFWNKADEEYFKKVNSIPEQERIEPSFDVSLKTIQVMQSRITDNDLRSLFINLLVSASDSRLKDGVLPSYPSLLADLTSDEAKLLIRFSNVKKANPFISVAQQVKVNDKIKGSIVVLKHFSKLASEAHCQFPDNIEQYIDNLARLNLIEIPEITHYSDDKIYEALENDPIISKLKEHIEKKSNEKVIFERKMVRITALGIGLCKACNIENLPSYVNDKD